MSKTLRATETASQQCSTSILEEKIYKNPGNEDFYVAIAKTIDEASSLIAMGYEFVHEYSGVMLYRKRK